MKSICIHATVPLLLALLGGCAHSTRLDGQFGDAVKAARLAQTINPLPPATTVVNGMDGEAARSAYESYQKSFKAPEPQAGALTVGVGR
jgi:hypothetical protein